MFVEPTASTHCITAGCVGEMIDPSTLTTVGPLLDVRAHFKTYNELDPGGSVAEVGDNNNGNEYMWYH